MSYDISLCDPVTHKPLKAYSTHFIAGGMRAMGGTKELWLNITYNYGHFYYRPEVFGEGGIRSIYGKTGAESIPMLEKAIAALGDDVDDSDYWNATEGNAKRALCGCTEASRVNHNISQQAKNFNITRRLSVVNARTDTPMLEIIGNMDISNNSSNELVVTIELPDGTYKKHYVYLNEYTMYIVEDLSGSDVDKYHYEINILPQQLQNFVLTYNP